MIKALAFLLAGVAAVWVQSILAQHLPIWGAAPDLALICVVYMGVFRNPIKGGLIVFCLGYTVDLFSGQIFGEYAGVYVVLFYTTRLLGRVFYMRSLSYQIASVALMTLAAKLLAAGVLLYVRPPGYSLLGLIDLGLLLPQLALNVICAPFVLKLLFKLEEITTSGFFSRRAAGWF